MYRLLSQIMKVRGPALSPDFYINYIKIGSSGQLNLEHSIRFSGEGEAKWQDMERRRERG